MIRRDARTTGRRSTASTPTPTGGPCHASRSESRCPRNLAPPLSARLLLALAVACSLTGAGLFAAAAGDLDRGAAARLVTAPAPPGPVVAARTKAIERVDIFDRVQGANPTLSEGDKNIPEPDPATWRVLRLRMTKKSGVLLHVKLARPLSWIERVQAGPGKAFLLDLPEMGAVGEAEALAIEVCPPLKPGQGSVVTGTFAHEADANLVTVQLSGGIEPIGVTDNHPFWSEDRRDFIPAGQLRQGERVRTRAGTAVVDSVAKRPVKSGEMVYNLEVHGEHVY